MNALKVCLEYDCVSRGMERVDMAGSVTNKYIAKIFREIWILLLKLVNKNRKMWEFKKFIRFYVKLIKIVLIVTLLIKLSISISRKINV